MEQEISQQITEEQALTELKRGYKKSEKILNDQSKLDKFLKQMEAKLKVIPGIGGKLSHVPVFLQLVKDFTTKKYTRIPMGSLIAVVSALCYVLLPVDLISDMIPCIGYIDDGIVVTTCLSLVENDIKHYLEWRDNEIIE